MSPREQQYQRNCEILKKYIPGNAVELIAGWIIEYDFKLKIKKERSTKLGDYTSPYNNGNHLITINYNLNKYSFLITLVHEIAHLTTYNKFKNRVQPHGTEWKNEFKLLMDPFLNPETLPIDVLYAVKKYLQNPAASSCTDTQLLKTLKSYDEDEKLVFLEYIPYQSTFLYNGNKIFQKGEKIRKRFRCKEIKSGHIYLFNPLTEVELFEHLPNNQGSR
jgi:SprT protein